MFTNDIPSKEEFIETLSKEGADTTWAGRTYDYYQSTGWKDGQGKAIGSWKAYGLMAWRKEQQRTTTATPIQGNTLPASSWMGSSTRNIIERGSVFLENNICRKCPNYHGNRQDGCPGLSPWASTGVGVTFFCAYSDKTLYCQRKDSCFLSRTPTKDDPRSTIRFKSPDILAGGQRIDTPYEPKATAYRLFDKEGDCEWVVVYLNTTQPLDQEMLARQSDKVQAFFKSFPTDELRNAVETSKRQGFFREWVGHPITYGKAGDGKQATP